MTLSERFWSKVDRLPGADSCWIWRTNISRLGYGRITVNNRSREAHRVAWELAHGPIPAGQHVLHACDNTRCVRPDHLHLGGHLDNMREMAERGRRRGPVGVSHHFAKFTPEMVRKLRQAHANGASIKSLATAHGVAFNAMWRLIRRKSWAHVT